MTQSPRSTTVVGRDGALDVPVSSLVTPERQETRVGKETGQEDKDRVKQCVPREVGGK